MLAGAAGAAAAGLAASAGFPASVGLAAGAAVGLGAPEGAQAANNGTASPQPAAPMARLRNARRSRLSDTDEPLPGHCPAPAAVFVHAYEARLPSASGTVERSRRVRGAHPTPPRFRYHQNR